MADIKLREYYSNLHLLCLDQLIAHKMSMSSIIKFAALKAYIEADFDRYKRMLISKELKKPFLQKLFELKGVV